MQIGEGKGRVSWWQCGVRRAAKPGQRRHLGEMCQSIRARGDTTTIHSLKVSPAADITGEKIAERDFRPPRYFDGKYPDIRGKLENRLQGIPQRI